MKYLLIWSGPLFPLLVVTTVFAGGGHGGQEEAVNGLLSYSTIIAALGITTLLALVTTLSLGLNMRKNRKLLFPWHKRMAITSVILAIIHAFLVLILHG